MLKLLWERLAELNVLFFFQQIFAQCGIESCNLKYSTPLNKCGRIPFNLYELYPLKSSRLFEQMTSQKTEPLSLIFQLCKSSLRY